MKNSQVFIQTYTLALQLNPQPDVFDQVIILDQACQG